MRQISGKNDSMKNTSETPQKLQINDQKPKEKSAPKKPKLNSKLLFHAWGLDPLRHENKSIFKTLIFRIFKRDLK
jgi:hypothetical protein